MSVEQRTEALELANATRITIANWKRDVRALSTLEGFTVLAEVLLRTDDLGLLGRMKTIDALLSIRRLGRLKSNRLMEAAGICRPDKRLDALTERQRRVLAFQLESLGRAWRGQP